TGVRPRPDTDRRYRRHAVLHGARTGEGAARAREAVHRCLRPGHDPLRSADRTPALQGGDPDVDAQPGDRPGALAPRKIAAAHAARPGNDLPEVFGEGPAGTVSDGARARRRPAPVPRKPPDPGAPAELVTVGLAVVSP